MAAACLDWVGRKLFFTDIRPVAKQAARAQRLEEEDLPLTPGTGTHEIWEEFKANWTAEVARYEAALRAAKEAEAKAAKEGAEADVKAPRMPSTGKAIWPLLSCLVLSSIFLFAISVGLQYMGPLILGEILKLLAEETYCVGDCESRLWWGYVLAALLLCSTAIGSLLRSHSEILMTRAALRCRAAVMCALYRKCLRLSGVGSTSTSSSGQIQNLMSTDAQQFLQIAAFFNLLWSAPLQVIVSIIWLSLLLGPALGVALAVMILFLPLQAKCGKTLIGNRRAQLKITDERVKVVNEVVQGMRVVKLSGWEGSVRSKLLSVREREVARIRSTRKVTAAFSTLLVAQPAFVLVCTFCTYAGLGNELKPEVVIPAMSLLAQLRVPLNFLPFVVIQALSLRVSLKRVGRFLLNPEIDEANVMRGAEEVEAMRTPSPEKKAANGGTELAEVMVVPKDGAPPANGNVSPASPAGQRAERPASAEVRLAGDYFWDVPEVMIDQRGRGGRGGGRGGRGGGRGRFWRRAKAPEAPPVARETSDASETLSPLSPSPVAPPAIAGPVSPLQLPAPPPADVPPAEPTSPLSPAASAPTSSGAPPAAALPPGVKRGPSGGSGRRRRKSKEKKKPAPPTLVGLDLTFPRGELTMVIGAVGSGKSSLLAALLGEMRPAEAAELSIPGRIAFAAQTPFIASDTLRGNVLFGLPLDDEYYNRTLEACALASDLDILAGGDMTQIGEKGVNLSGGQKARIALARACYTRASVLLLDDPLSAVDAHVGKHLFTHVLGPAGLLADTTRILNTHQTQFLPLADRVVVMEEGRVVASGTYAELKASHADRFSALSTEGVDDEADGEGGDKADGADGSGGKGADDGASAGVGELTKRRSAVDLGNAKAGDAGARLTQVEERQIGAVPGHVYGQFMRAGGGKAWFALAVGMILVDRAITTFVDVWLTMWIDQEFGREDDDLGFWMPIYGGLAVAAAIAVYSRGWVTLVVIGVRAARGLHEALLDAVLAAPVSFFETTPSGRILNRFTADTEAIDFQLLSMLGQWINCLGPVFASLALITVVNYWFLGGLIPLVFAYVAVYVYSAPATRNLQRLESVSRSPIFSHFSETLGGLSTIRALGAAPRFEQHSMGLVDRNTRCFYGQYLLNAWVSLFLDGMSAIVVFLSALFPVLSITVNRASGGSDASATLSIPLAGIAISYALELALFLKACTRSTLELQKGMAAVERIVDYSENTPSERRGGASPPGHWPTAGAITITKLSVRYRPELPLALRAVSCVIPPAAKVGIVGRTGSGKSTFLAVLWRLIEAEGGVDGRGAGAVCIDGVDVQTLMLAELRARLAIIPQDPVMFNDTLRYNLDPFGERSDDELRQVLELVQMKGVVGTLADGLGHRISEGGANFSVGQRQLVCLARAALRKAPILALDEATASIDNETDAVLQAAIRKQFAECTVLTIAHRLHTIMDSTSVMVFESGALAEHDAPAALLDDPASLFSQLVAKTGSAAPHLRAMANAAVAVSRMQRGASDTRADKWRGAAKAAAPPSPEVTAE